MSSPAGQFDAAREAASPAGPSSHVVDTPPSSLAETALWLQRHAGNGAVTRLFREPDAGAEDPVIAELRVLNGCEIGDMLGRLKAKSSDDLVALQGKLEAAGVNVPRMRLAIKVCGWTSISEQGFVEIQPLLQQVPVDQQDVVARWVGLTGLAAPSRIEEYVAGAAALRSQWVAATSAAERVRLLIPLITKALSASRVPLPKDYPILPIGPGGQWNAEHWCLEISDRLGSLTGDEETFARLAATLFHEARHAEQDFLSARLMVSRGRPVTGILPEVVNAARDAGPLPKGSAEEARAAAWYESVHGSGAAERGKILGDLANRNEDYRNLPEERDAHAVGNRVHDGLITNPPNRDLDAGTVTDPVAGLK